MRRAISMTRTEKQEHAQYLRNEGMNLDAIAKETGLSRTWVVENTHPKREKPWERKSKTFFDPKETEEKMRARIAKTPYFNYYAVSR